MDPLTIAMLASAGIGAAGSLFGGQNKPETTQLPNYAPWQEAMARQAGQRGMAGIEGLPAQYQQLMQGLNFDPIEQNAMRGFQQNVVPGLAERFSSMGTGGSQGSSAFAQQLGGAGSDLMSQLAALRAQYGLQRGQLGGQLLGNLGNLYGGQANMGMSPLFSNMVQQGGPNAIARLGQFGGDMFGRLAPFGAMNMMGGNQGGQNRMPSPGAPNPWLPGSTQSNPFGWS